MPINLHEQQILVGRQFSQQAKSMISEKKKSIWKERNKVKNKCVLQKIKKMKKMQAKKTKNRLIESGEIILYSRRKK